jgi:hypothetical protein
VIDLTGTLEEVERRLLMMLLRFLVEANKDLAAENERLKRLLSERNKN